MMAVLRRIDTYEEVCMSVREKEGEQRQGGVLRGRLYSNTYFTNIKNLDVENKEWKRIITRVITVD